jgi:hypothetical protein
MWWAASWHKLLICLLVLDHLWRRIQEGWDQFSRFKTYVVRQIGDRRKTMGNLVSKFEEISGAVAALEALVPMIEKTLDDAKAAAPQLEADVDAIKLKLETIFKTL